MEDWLEGLGWFAYWGFYIVLLHGLFCVRGSYRCYLILKDGLLISRNKGNRARPIGDLRRVYLLLIGCLPAWPHQIIWALRRRIVLGACPRELHKIYRKLRQFLFLIWHVGAVSLLLLLHMGFIHIVVFNWSVVETTQIDNVVLVRVWLLLDFPTGGQ
jgi:hypothetical protein